MDKHFWQGKKVLITGYEGFLGSWLVRTLLTTGADIFGLDIKTFRKETILTRQDLSRIHIIKGNIKNFTLVSNTIRDNKIEIIFHLAAKSLVGDCLKNPLEGLSTNIQGTWNILESCRNADCVKTIVVASSDKAYGEHKKLPYKEDTPLQGNHPYDVSKSCGDLIAQMYHHTFGLPVAITRCGNIYGPGDFNFFRIVPDAIKCALTDKTFIIRSDGKFIRDYVYVEDVVDGYIKIAERLQKLKLGGQAFNLSNETPLSVIELVGLIYKIAQKKPCYKILNKVKYEIKQQYLCSKKAKRILGWKPRYNLQNGLKKTISGYQEIFYGQ
jgi:CDP-glucose 4,6-dehydratase